jgi:hypothetical protein
MRLAIYIVLCALLAGCVQQTIVQPPADNVSITYESEPQTVVVYREPNAGRAVFTITDAPVRMSDIHELWVTVDKVEVQSVTQGWITVSSGQHKYDLLQLREEGAQGILADVALEPGTYEQVRLTISDVEVVDASGGHKAVLPSGTLRFTAPFTVVGNMATVVQFDFDLSSSLHVTGNGRYVLTPVIRVVTYENVGVRVLASQLVVVQGGTEREIVVVGTNEAGDVGPGLRIPVDVTVRVEPGTEKVIIVNQTTNVSGTTNTSVNVTTNTTTNASA